MFIQVDTVSQASFNWGTEGKTQQAHSAIFKESVTHSPILVKSKYNEHRKRRVRVFRHIQALLTSEYKVKRARIGKLKDLFIVRMKQMYAQHQQRIDASK